MTSVLFRRSILTACVILSWQSFWFISVTEIYFFTLTQTLLTISILKSQNLKCCTKVKYFLKSLTRIIDSQWVNYLSVIPGWMHRDTMHACGLFEGSWTTECATGRCETTPTFDISDKLFSAYIAYFKTDEKRSNKAQIKKKKKLINCFYLQNT